MYTDRNFKTKKEFREAVAKWVAYQELQGKVAPMTIGAVMIQDVRPPRPVRLYAPGLGQPVENGTDFVEGPHYPAPHSWYAKVVVKDGVVVSVK